MTPTNSPCKRPEIAAHWWRLTNNLLATGVILAVGLALGREVVHGWRRTPTPGESTATDANNLAKLPITGPLLSARFQGTSEAATEELAKRCVEACRQQRTPVGEIPVEALAAGRRWGEYDGFELYLAEGEPPMLAAVSRVSEAATRAVYCWGFAMPGDESDSSEYWTLYISAPGKTPAQE